MVFQMLLYGLGLFFVTVVLCHFIYRRAPKSAISKKKLSGANEAHSQLICACFGDRAAAVRLADYEQSLERISRFEAIRRALDRLEQDRL